MYSPSFSTLSHCSLPANLSVAAINILLVHRNEGPRRCRSTHGKVILTRVEASACDGNRRREWRNDDANGVTVISLAKLPRNTLEQMLRVCTTEAPFRSPEGKLFQQIDGVAMGSPLGVLFANAYMCWVEDRVIPSFSRPLHVYKRYIDDIFVEIDNEETLEALQQAMQDASVLQFTFEVGVDRKLPFLDVDVSALGNRHQMTVFRKKTNGGKCMNGASECPQRYKLGVVRAYIRRAIKTCTSWDLLHAELQKVKQMLVNNNSPQQNHRH